MKFQLTFEVEGLESDETVETIEADAEAALMDLGFSNVDCKVV